MPGLRLCRVMAAASATAITGEFVTAALPCLYASASLCAIIVFSAIVIVQIEHVLIYLVYKWSGMQGAADGLGITERHLGQ